MIGPAGGRPRIAWVIALRGFRGNLYGAGLYVVTTIGCAIAAVLTAVYAGTAREDGLLILANPLTLPLNLAITVGAVYFAFAASAAISRERDSGTLEVLFYGPVDAAGFVAAKYLEQLLSFLVMLVLETVVFVLLSAATNFGLAEIGYALLLAVPLVSCIIAFGILVSALTVRARSSFLLLGALLIVFLTAQWGEAAVASSYAGSLLAVVSGCIGWISPFRSEERRVG